MPLQYGSPFKKQPRKDAIIIDSENMEPSEIAAIYRVELRDLIVDRLGGMISEFEDGINESLGELFDTLGIGPISIELESDPVVRFPQIER